MQFNPNRPIREVLASGYIATDIVVSFIFFSFSITYWAEPTVSIRV